MTEHPAAPTTEAAGVLNFYLRGALIGYPPDAIARILAGASDHILAIESEARAAARKEVIAAIRYVTDNEQYDLGYVKECARLAKDVVARLDSLSTDTREEPPTDE